MFNSIRQYLSQNYQSGSHSSDNYQYQDNWRQQRNHHVGNWLTDMAYNQHQPFYEKDTRQHFWNRGRKKKHYFDPSRQSYDNAMYYNNGYSNGNNRLRNKSSHKSISSLFHRHKDEDDYGRNRYQQGLGSQNNEHNSPKSSNYTRQRHNSLPSFSKNSLHQQQQHHHQQPFMSGKPLGSGGNPMMDVGIPVLTAAAVAAGNHLGGAMASGAGGLGNPLLPQHHLQQQQQQRQQPYSNRHSLPMQGQHYNNSMMDHHNQQNPYNTHQSRHRFSNLLFGRHDNDRSRHQYQPDHYSLDNSAYHNPYSTPEQQQALNFYHQQQQQQHAYPYSHNDQYGGGGMGMHGNNHHLLNNHKRHT